MSEQREWRKVWEVEVLPDGTRRERLVKEGWAGEEKEVPRDRQEVRVRKLEGEADGG